MNKKNYAMTAIFSMSFGLIGSFLGSYFTVQPVSAQNKEVIKEVIKAQSFQLVDKKGKNRGGMDATSDTTMFHLTDKNGKTNMTIQTSEDRSSIDLFNNKKQMIVSLDLDPKTSETSLRFYSDKQKRLANGSIQLISKLSLMSSNKTTQVMLTDNKDIPSVFIQGNENGESGSVSLMKNDKLFWNAPN